MLQNKTPEKTKRPKRAKTITFEPLIVDLKTNDQGYGLQKKKTMVEPKLG